MSSSAAVRADSVLTTHALDMVGVEHWSVAATAAVPPDFLWAVGHNSLLVVSASAGHVRSTE